MSRTVLYVSASPRKQSRVGGEEEAKIIQDSLEVPRCEASKFIAQPACSFGRLTLRLREHRPEYLHIGCHGTSDSIHFKDGAVSGADLIDELKAHPSLKGVIFTACSSASIAERLAAFVPFAIGVREDISVDASIEYSKFFYQTFAYGSAVDAWHSAGVRGLKRNDEFKAEADFPVLFTQGVTVERVEIIYNPDSSRLRRLRAKLAAFFKKPEHATLVSALTDALNAQSSTLVDTLLGQEAITIISILLEIRDDQPSLQEGLRKLATLALPAAVDWVRYQTRHPDGRDGPDLVVPFLRGPLCELVVAGVGDRPADLQPEASRTHVQMPALAQLGVLDLTPHLAPAIGMGILQKDGWTKATLPDDVCVAANSLVKAYQRRGQMYLLYRHATPEILAALRKDLSALWYVQGDPQEDGGAAIYSLLKDLLGWP